MCRLLLVLEVAFWLGIPSWVKEREEGLFTITLRWLSCRIVTSQDHDVAGITKLVTESVPRAELSRSHGLEVSFTLPLQDVSLFPRMLD